MDLHHGFEVLEHPADLLIRAYGETLEGAFLNAAWALYAHLFEAGSVEWMGEDGKLEFEAEDLDALLQGFLDELLYHFEVHRRIYRPKDASIFQRNGTYILVFTYGGTTTYDPEKHGIGTEIKAVTYHMMEVGKRKEGGFYVQVLFDI